MKKLGIGDSYKHMNYTLTVTRREKDIVLAEHPEYGFEVFRVKVRKEGTAMSGAIIPAGEYGPKNSDFGKDCQHFSPRFMRNAHICFDKLVERSPIINADPT